MKFTCAIDINAPINYVSELFKNPEYLKYHQDGFISKEHLSGTVGSKAAKSKLTYKRLELIETIITNNLPDEFMALYEHKHTTNTMKVNFEALSDTKTKYISEIEYTAFNGFLINVLVKLFPSMFKKQVYKWMQNFKTFCESKYSEQH
ncbi:SRPBCC family protein [Ichthyenterobacterium magnum]|uniref:Polyketide cyclase/dehydrase/lipid transport protein n=1 Tax=Ichthyenterobacterium magnum TaxID=1230530 RepID=A0A420DKI0_9FLAO|nr:SRPBCC family protein [Ichthyenterobacterium magnum]RKE94708.1 hypothetical protein BXY80_1719 [Ichthyenterobacterium magnum]